MERDNIIKLILIVTLLVTTVFAKDGTGVYWLCGGLIVYVAFVLWTRKNPKDNEKDEQIWYH